jgi:hypothetical protein
LQRFTLYTLSDDVEQDDHCAHIYNKSLLYLVTNAFEERRGERLLGLEKHVEKDRLLTRLIQERAIEWVCAPNDAPADSRWASAARRHGDFDDDALTLRSTLARILQSWEDLPEFDFQRSEASLQAERAQLDSLTG